MLYSSASKYAVRALSYMTSCEEQKIFTVDELAKGADVPKPYLSKILKQLVAGKILKSSKGPGGGYQFARPVEKISLYDIKVTIDGITEFVDCVLGLDACNDAAPCPAHYMWRDLRARTTTALQTTTLPYAQKILHEKALHPEGAKKKTKAKATVANKKV
ncbi:MAG: putative HTH-type transcriptional regulator [Turneriella sp.]|nr:putative HTH-type transcriptional regulator [Turneriella sp.]